MASAATISGPGSGVSRSDRRLLLALCTAVLAVVVVVSLVAPTTANNDPRPSSYNTAPGGAKAAFLALEAMGRPVARWERPLDELTEVDAAHTTLLLLAPRFTALNKDQVAGAVRNFLERGGRVLTTGAQGALLIPGGSIQGSDRFRDLCYTQPEGPGVLALAGQVEMEDTVRWGNETPDVFVEQRCGPEAVVIRKRVGRGEVIWWSSATPLTNRELHNDADLRLLLASLGQGRRVLFDESLQEAVRSPWSAARGLPLWWLLGQAGLVFAALVFSFSRRRGPVRLPVAVPRSSPVEFAVSMGDLYEKAGATGAATEAARRRLERVLVREAGLPLATVHAGPEAIQSALEKKFGGSWSALREHLQQASIAAETDLKAGSALRLVRALGEDAQRVRGVAGLEPASRDGATDPAVSRMR